MAGAHRASQSSQPDKERTLALHARFTQCQVVSVTFVGALGLGIRRLDTGLIVILGASIGLVISTFEYMRRYSTPLLEVKTHIAHHKVIDATRGRYPTPRELRLIPSEGDVYFRLVEPYDRLLAPVPSDDQPVSFGYHRVDCEPRLKGPDSVDDYVLLCRPSRILVGTEVVLSTARTRRKQMLVIFVYALFLVGGIALGFKVRSVERWWWRSA